MEDEDLKIYINGALIVTLHDSEELDTTFGELTKKYPIDFDANDPRTIVDFIEALIVQNLELEFKNKLQINVL